MTDAIFTPEGSVLAADMFRMVYGAVLTGSPSPRVAAMYRRMNQPEVGDRVIVTDSVYGSDVDKKWKGSGTLVGIDGDDEWDKAWLVNYGPNEDDICRWTNCQVLAIPTGLQDAYEQERESSDPKEKS